MMSEAKDRIAEKFLELVEIMARLRAPGGCPWDIKQTHATLKKYMIEEAYELVESIDQGDEKALVEECGDVLLQVVFHAQMASEANHFNILDVLETLCNKLVSRHPHVFGDRSAHTAEEVLRNWEADKQREKPERESILDGIPATLPALMQAHDIQGKASRVGFDWNRVEEVFDKFEEEWREFREACAQNRREQIEAEMGDLFFALVNLARYQQVDAEQALRKTNRKFKERFQFIEQALKEKNSSPRESTLAEMDALWEEAKQRERTDPVSR